ncbi:MAG: HEAT repeat domain-containing protein [Reichenbachiella sp.]
MNTELISALEKLTLELDDYSYESSDLLARSGDEEVMQSLIKLLTHENLETRFIAARTLSKYDKNEPGLAPLLEAIKAPENESIIGELFSTLEGFDISGIYVDIFKQYLFGNFKVSSLAQDLINHQSFDITPRVLKKATKHWKHYANNVKQDELYDLKKMEVDTLFADLQAFIDTQEFEKD